MESVSNDRKQGRGIVFLPVSRILPHPNNPRKELGDLTELAESIKAKGVLQNLTVVPATEEEGLYRAVIGHRRLGASKLAGLTEVPCIIADMTEREQFETMMVENVQRSDLTPYEQAEGFQMMLDMGDSVEEVARKTGFSESTVRRRAKLLELDRKKFHSAQERGGTMQDYLKLNDIRDPERRNRVLDSIGTSNFQNTLRNALEDQKFQDEFKDAVKEIKSATWCRKRTDETTGWNGDYQHHRTYDRWNKKPIAVPKDLEKADYIYTVSGETIYIYRKGPAAEKKKSEQELKKEAFQKKVEKIEKRLQKITATHREMREAFVREFSAFETNEMDILAWAAKTFRLPGHGYADAERVGNLSGIEVKKGNMDKAGWDSLLFHQPLRALMYSVYAVLEGTNRKYYWAYWNTDAGCSVAKHEKDNFLDLLYEGLKSLGYEMSDEEIQMQTGKHPLFKEASNLVKEYCKDKKAKKK